MPFFLHYVPGGQQLSESPHHLGSLYELEYRRLLDAAGLKLNRVIPLKTGASMLEVLPV